MGTAGVAVAEAEVEAAEVRAEMVRKDGGRGSSSGSDGLELGWAEPDGMTESGMALKGWEGADGMGWDDRAAYAPTRTEVRKREKGSKEREAPQNNCVLYLFHFPPGRESRGGKRGGEGDRRDTARGGIRNPGGRQAHSKQSYLASSSNGSGVEGQECSQHVRDNNTTRHD